MAAPRKDLPDIMRGDSRTWVFRFKDANGDPVNIANTDFWSTLKLNKDDLDADAALQKKITFPNDANSQNGVGTLKWTKEETGALEPGTKYWYDFQWVRPATDDVDTMAWGRIEVLQDMTQETA